MQLDNELPKEVLIGNEDSAWNVREHEYPMSMNMPWWMRIEKKIELEGHGMFILNRKGETISEAKLAPILNCLNLVRRALRFLLSPIIAYKRRAHQEDIDKLYETGIMYTSSPLDTTKDILMDIIREGQEITMRPDGKLSVDGGAFAELHLPAYHALVEHYQQLNQFDMNCQTRCKDDKLYDFCVRLLPCSEGEGYTLTAENLGLSEDQ